MRCFLYIVAFCIASPVLYAVADTSKKTILCGVAKGFPPYQYQAENLAPTGLDVEIIRNVATRMGKTIVFQQLPWDKVITSLRLGRIDCIAGIEINKKRETFFDFTTPYYMRKVVVFVREDNTNIQTIHDLRWQVVAGDRHSFVEEYFNQIGLRSQIRLYQTDSKETSMLLLQQKTIVAVIAPLEVGLYLAQKHHVKIKILDNLDPGSPVGIAVAKGNTKLLKQIEISLQKLKQEGTIDSIVAKWRSPKK